MIRAITEVGVAVRDLQAAIDLLTQRLGALPGPVQDFEPYGMVFCLCRVGNVDFELMAPTRDDGVIARFLARRGEGVHHIAFGVDDVHRAQEAMSASGMEFLDPQPRSAHFLMKDFAGREFAMSSDFTFSKPSSSLGMLLEFIQYPPDFVFSGAPPTAG